VWKAVFLGGFPNPWGLLAVKRGGVQNDEPVRTGRSH